MGISVRERADTVATFRFINVFLMETLAAWVPTTPEMEVKVLFGRHLWDLAQHADEFGKRAGELRLGLHASREPVPAFKDILRRVAEAKTTSERVDGFYAGIVPVLLGLYEAYMKETDPLMDEPTVRVVERAVGDLTRMRTGRAELQQDWPTLPKAEQWAQQIVAAAEEVPQFVDFRPAPEPQEVS